MNKKSLIIITVFSLALATLVLPNAEAQPRDPTSLNLSPSSFTVKSGESITLTATLTSGGSPLTGKTVEFAATNGSVSPSSATTNSEGEATVTYSAPVVSTRDSTTVTATFAGNANYEASENSSTGTIKVNQPPTASFNYSPTSPKVDEIIQFSDNSTDPDGSITDWTWRFGDGTSSDKQNPAHSYAAPGVYKVKLTVKDDGAPTKADTVTKNIEVTRKPTTLDLSPSSFEINSGENIILTATLTSNGDPLADKNIEFGATNGSVAPNIGTTNSEGEVSVTYTAPKVSLRASATITASFSGDVDYKASSDNATATIEVAPIVPLKAVTVSGAAFCVPETLKDDISSYSATVPEEIETKIPVKVPSTGFLLATEENLMLVLSGESDKGLASVEGWKMPESTTLANENLSVIVADNLSIDKTGTAATISEILSNPQDYRLDLVKVTATRRHLSVLYDPDDGSGVEVSLTAGYLVKRPKQPSELIKKAIRRGKDFLRSPNKPLLKDLLQPGESRLSIFDFENDYWIDCPAVSNGIVLTSENPIFDLLGKSIPQVGKIARQDNRPILYDVKTSLEFESVPSVDEINRKPEEYRDVVVGFDAKGHGAGISLQETIYETTGEKLPVDVRLEGVIAWNELSVPPENSDFLTTYGASSIHQDSVIEPIEGRFKYIGRVLSSKRIDETLPEGLTLVVYDKERIGDIDYEELGKSARKRIENNLSTVNWTLTGFTGEPVPAIPTKPPERVFRPTRPITVHSSRDLPSVIGMAENITLRVESVSPEEPIRLGVENSRISELKMNLKEPREDLEISLKKLRKKPPELPDPPGLVWAYQEISTNIPEEAIENAGINFWVLKEWLETYGTDREDILLLRYHRGQWENLPTTLIDENATHFKYSAKTPGYSTFVITAKKAKAGVARFSLKNLSIGKKTLKPGESTTVSVDVKNTGEAKGSKTVKLKIEGEVADKETVTLSSGESKTVEFPISKEKEGTYEVTVGEMSESFTVEKVAAKLELRSEAFQDGENIPVKYTADGRNISPPLTIRNVPDQAKSLALVVVDLDAPGGKFTHWVMWNMPTDINHISKDVPKAKTVEELGGAKQGRNDFGEIGYGGPSPPKGSSHRYRFTLYALDKELELSAGGSKGVLLKLMEDHVLQKSVLIGKYEVKKALKATEFEVSNLNLSKEKVKQGETTTVSIEVTNTGGKKGTYTAEISIDGEVKTQSVTLKPDESEKVTFKLSREKAGNYQIKIGKLSKSLNVKKPEGAEKPEKGIPWLIIGGVIIVVIAISAFILYRRK